MCRSLDEGGRRCSGFSSDPAAARARKRLSRARQALRVAEESDEPGAFEEAFNAVTSAQSGLDEARRAHELAHSGRELNAEERYRVLLAQQRGHRRVLRPVEAEAMSDYVANSDRFNAHLRDPDAPTDQRTRDQVAAIRRVLSRSVLDRELTVYRVVPAEAANIDRAFLSTTLDPQFARDFQKQHAGRATRILEITVPAGSRALFINNTFEREVLLDGVDNHPSRVFDAPAEVG